MNKFDKIALMLGWDKPYKSIPLWCQEHKKGIRACFDINYNYDRFKDDIRIDVDFVKGSLNFYSKTIFKKENSNWVIPMLVSDYFAHREDWDNELIWAKKAMKQNKKLTPLQFSVNIREKL